MQRNRKSLESKALKFCFTVTGAYVMIQVFQATGYVFIQVWQ